MEKYNGLKEIISDAIMMMTKEASHPEIGFHYKKIYEFISKKGWWKGFKTPETSVNVALNLHRDIFVSVLGHKGHYTLKKLTENHMSLEVTFPITYITRTTKRIWKSQGLFQKMIYKKNLKKV